MRTEDGELLFKFFGEYEAAIASHSPTPIPRPTKDGELYYEKGEYQRAMGEYEQAIGYFSIAIEIVLGQQLIKNSYLNRGISYASLGQHLLAIQDFDSAIGWDRPNHKSGKDEKRRSCAAVAEEVKALEPLYRRYNIAGGAGC